MVRAVYPGTFDPITNGHIDLVRRASPLFEEIVVAMAHNVAKKTVFSLEERMALVETCLADIANIRVVAVSGLLVDFAAAQQAHVILRGLRAASDFEFEFQMAGMNRHLAPQIETLFLRPAEEYAYLSSSLVKEVASFGGDVTDFVHPAVFTALQSRLASGA